MNAPAFTPGEWHTEETIGGDFDIKGDNREWIATVQAYADARLIASAPTQNAALVDIIETAQSFDWASVPPATAKVACIAALQLIVEKAEVALRAARGAK